MLLWEKVGKASSARNKGVQSNAIRLVRKTNKGKRSPYEIPREARGQGERLIPECLMVSRIDLRQQGKDGNHRNYILISRVQKLSLSKRNLPAVAAPIQIGAYSRTTSGTRGPPSTPHGV